MFDKLCHYAYVIAMDIIINHDEPSNVGVYLHFQELCSVWFNHGFHIWGCVNTQRDYHIWESMHIMNPSYCGVESRGFHAF